MVVGTEGTLVPRCRECIDYGPWTIDLTN